MAAHPEFDLLTTSWELDLDAAKYAPNTLRGYRQALRHFATFVAVAPAEVTRHHVRAWLVEVRQTRSNSTSRSWYPAVRGFFRWCVTEGEAKEDPTDGIRTPPPDEPETPLLTVEQIKALLKVCNGDTFEGKRDRAIIRVLADCGLRLSELTGLSMSDVDVKQRLLFVEGKGSNRSGPRRRAVPFGVKTAQTLDRYIRDRRRHPYAELPAFWLGRPNLGPQGVQKMLRRKGKLIGVDVHPHMFRHTWADSFRVEGGQEGDLMVLGGWRSRIMLDRYGKTNAQTRAREAYRGRSLGDKL